MTMMMMAISVQEMEDVMKTNFFGPFNITQAILPKMRATGKGTLCYMSSQAGWHGDPGAAGYCSSKFAVEGMAECLSKELAVIAPAVRVLLFEPGYFRTRAFHNVNYTTVSDASDYSQFHSGAVAHVEGVKSNEPGDPDKGVDRMIEIIKGTGVAAGRTVPLRVPLGSDGWGKVHDKCVETLKICEEWEDVARSTDVDSSA